MNENVNKLIENTLSELDKNTYSTNDLIDLGATKAVTEKKDFVDELVKQKSDELINIAEAKKTDAELLKFEAESKKEIEMLNHQIKKLKVEAEKLTANTNKAQSFFEANKEILKVIGVKRTHSYPILVILMIVALIFYIPVSIMLFIPFSVVEYIVCFFVDIAGNVSKKLATNGLKVVFGILSTALTGGLLYGIYYIIYQYLLKA